MDNICRFCGRSEHNSDETLICSNCVQKLLFLDNEHVQVLRTSCLEKGQVEKVELLDKFLIEKGANGKQSKSYFKKRLNGARPTRFIGIDKNSSHRPSSEQRVAVY